MKRQRRSSGPCVDAPGRTGAVCFDASAVWAKPATAAPLVQRAQTAGSEGRVWAKYIDSRLKQFGTR